MVGLEKILIKCISVWDIINLMIISANLILVSVDYNASLLAKIYLNEIVGLPGELSLIVPGRSTLFNSKFWERFYF